METQQNNIINKKDFFFKLQIKNAERLNIKKILAKFERFKSVHTLDT